MVATIEAPPIVTGEVESIPASATSLVFPVKAMRVVNVAAKQPTRYAFDGVCVSTSKKLTAGLTIAATDGRRCVRVVAEESTASAKASIVIPGRVVLAALKIADRPSPKAKVPTANVLIDGKDCKLIVTSGGASVVFSWKDEAGQFPPINDVIPETPAEKGTVTIGVNPALMSGMMTTMREIVGEVTGFKITMPETPNRPIRVDATSGGLAVTGVIMPVNLH